MPELDERKRTVLAAVVHEHVATAEPVSSQAIVEKHGLRVSPATVRHEMVQLEHLGYVRQPHTSAGRIPADPGYRFYVDHLRPQRPISARDQAWLQQLQRTEAHELATLLQEVCRLLSSLTGYTSVVIAPVLEEAILRYIAMAPIQSHQILVVLVTDNDQVEHRLFRVETAPDARDLRRLTQLLNEKLAGRQLSLLEEMELDELWREGHFYSAVLHQVLRLLQRDLAASRRKQVFLDGIICILEHPEFRDVDTAREIMATLEKDDLLADALAQAGQGTGPVSVCIGTENPVLSLQSCSLVTASYGREGRVLGRIGLIGPTRMDYVRAFPTVEYVARLVDVMLTRM
jgi:heat-inducible transcriptional repressor